MNVNIYTFTLAEVSFAIPAKRNYTLQDYPNVGTNSSFECKGATVSSLLIESSDTISSNSMFSSLAPFVGVIFTLEENIDGDPVFEDFEKLFFMYTANYPTWSGERLIHDPTFTVYYVSGGGPGFPFLPLLVITIILSIVISVAVPATYRTFTIQKHKNARKTKTTSKIRSESKMGSVKVNNEASDGVGIRSEFEIDSSRFLNILRQENAYELLDKLNLTLTTKDFWKIIEKLELSAEDERQFVQDMLSLTPIERQKMLFNMLKLKDSNNSETFL